MRLLTFLLLLLCHQGSRATNYYMASDGSDANSGMSPDAAWLTLEKLSSQPLIAGDSVLFRSGDVFRGTYFLNADGSIAGATIFIGTFGGTAPAVIDGSEAISGWTLGDDGIYAATVTKAVKGLFVSGKLQTTARYPNSGFLWIDESVNGNLGFVSNSLSQPDGYWNNAKVHVRTTPEFYEVRNVQSFAGGNVAFDQPTGANTQPGFGYFFSGLFSLLDSSGEWHYDQSANQLFYKPQTGDDPNALSIFASVFDYGIFSDQPLTNVAINNLAFRHQGMDGVRMLSHVSRLEIRECFFQKIGQTGASLLVADEFVFTENHLENIFACAMTLGQAEKCKIENCHFSRIGLLEAMHVVGVQSGNGISIINGFANSICNNTFDSLGASAVWLSGSADTIRRNLVSNAALVTGNRGAIGTYDATGFVIANNIISKVYGDCASCSEKDAKANGIFLGSDCNAFKVESNTVSNVSEFGLIVQEDNSDHVLLRNVFYNSRSASVAFVDNGLNIASQTNNLMKGNVLYGLSPSQKSYWVYTNNDTVAWASCDSNYFVNPYNYSTVSYSRFLPSEGYVFTSTFTLPEWQLLRPDDSSTVSTFIFLPRFKTNDTTGNDILVNGDFTNNFDSWNAGPETVIELLLDNSNQMDGGNVKARFHNLSSGLAQLVSSTLQTQSGQTYQLSFSVYGQDGGVFGPELLEDQGNGFVPAGYKIWRKSFSERINVVDHFVSLATSTNQFFKFSMSPIDSIYWFDNIHLYPVNAVKLDSTFFSRLITNTTNAPVTYSFADSNFFNLDSVQISSVTVPPYESVVVIYVPDYLNVNMKTPEPAKPSINLWPNPAGETVYVRYACVANPVRYTVYDSKGMRIKTGSLGNCGGAVDVSGLPSGIYMLQTVGDGGVQQRALVVNR